MKFILVYLLCFLVSVPAVSTVNFESIFKDRDACFLVADIETGKIVVEHNPIRCKKQFTPCSSFKIPAALMAFEKGIFKDENQAIKWDGIKRSRSEENRDQTPVSFMRDSVKWVTDWIMPQLGEQDIQNFLNTFNYGNKDFSGGLKNAWVSSSLKISAHEQLSFVSRLWKEELPLSKKSMELTKKIMFIQKIGNAELYGKTGTGCLVGSSCMSRPDKMIGTFVGVLKSDSKTYIFAANASDLKEQKSPAGPRLRDTTISLLKDLKITPE